MIYSKDVVLGIIAGFGRESLLKKKIKISSYVFPQKWSGAHMMKGFLKYEETRKYLVIYEEAVSCVWSLLGYEENCLFFFNSECMDDGWLSQRLFPGSILSPALSLSHSDEDKGDVGPLYKYNNFQIEFTFVSNTKNST